MRAAGPPASWSTTRRRSPTRRSTTPTTTPTRTAWSTSSWPSSPAAAATAPRSSPSPGATCRTRPPAPRRAVRQRRGRTPRRSSTTTPTPTRACPATPPTTSSRTSRAGRSGTPTTPAGPRRPPTRATPSRSSSGSGPYNVNPETAIDKASRHLPRVRPLPRPAGLLLHRQPRDLRRLEPDGDRQVAEHGRLLPPGARLGGARRCSSPASTTTVDGWTDSKQDTGTITWQAPRRHAVHADERGRRPRAQLRRCTSPSSPVGSCSTPRSSTAATGPARPTPGGPARATTSAALPTAGHNLDLAIPGLGDLPGGQRR